MGWFVFFFFLQLEQVCVSVCEDDDLYTHIHTRVSVETISVLYTPIRSVCTYQSALALQFSIKRSGLKALTSALNIQFSLTLFKSV